MNNWLREQLENLKKNAFGSKHESASDEVIGQMLLFDEPEAYAFFGRDQEQDNLRRGP